MTLDESVSMAFLVVLEAMTPAQRVALVLHDVFGYSFAEVAAVTGRSPAACRELASAARRRVRAARPVEAEAGFSSAAQAVLVFMLSVRLSLVAGPLRLLDGDFPDREFMRRIAEYNLNAALALLR